MMTENTLTATHGENPPFLRIPYDIRLLIYRYLIPAIDKNFKWASAWDPNRPRSHSEEHKLYSPSILHTNRTIYREVLNELHTFLPHRVALNNYGIRFMGYTFLQPPPAFQYIHTVDLMIHIDSYSHKKIAEFLRSYLEITGHLRRLQIGLTFSLLCFQTYSGNLRELRKVLEKNLHPLRRQLRGLDEFVVRKIKGNSLPGSNVSGAFLLQRDDFLNAVQSFMDQLVTDVMTKQYNSWPNKIVYGCGTIKHHDAEKERPWVQG